MGYLYPCFEYANCRIWQKHRFQTVRYSKLGIPVIICLATMEFVFFGALTPVGALFLYIKIFF